MADLLPIDRALCRTDPAAERLKQLLRETCQELGAAEATLWVLSDDGNHLEAALNVGPTSSTVEQLSVQVHLSVIGIHASTGTTTRVSGSDQHSAVIDEATGTRTRAMAATCVWVRNRIRGVLSAINPVNQEDFGPETAGRLEWKAYLTGLVLADAATMEL